VFAGEPTVVLYEKDENGSVVLLLSAASRTAISFYSNLVSRYATQTHLARSTNCC
jgi:hypothetical protein